MKERCESSRKKRSTQEAKTLVCEVRHVHVDKAQQNMQIYPTFHVCGPRAAMHPAGWILFTLSLTLHGTEAVAAPPFAFMPAFPAHTEAQSVVRRCTRPLKGQKLMQGTGTECKSGELDSRIGHFSPRTLIFGIKASGETDGLCRMSTEASVRCQVNEAFSLSCE